MGGSRRWDRDSPDDVVVDTEAMTGDYQTWEDERRKPHRSAMEAHLYSGL